MKDLPIGVFDSGVGGLTVINSMLTELPDEDFIYFGDTAHVPYGSKTPDQLMSYAIDIISFLMTCKVKAVVIACGTHSSVTLPYIAENYSFPLLGVVKAGARCAVTTSLNRRIGVIATHATVANGAYTREIQSINPGMAVREMACPRFVPLIESGKLDDAETRLAVREYIGPLMDEGIDTLVLGCTHYPFIAPLIKEFVGPQVQLVDPSQETVEELRQVLDRHQLRHGFNPEPNRKFYVSGNNESFFTVGKLLVGDVIQRVDHIPLD